MLGPAPSPRLENCLHLADIICMGEKVRKYVPRAPRYVLRPHDRSEMRFSLQNTFGQPRVEKTILLNLSESGVAFLVERREEFKLGDHVMVEVPIPSGEQIAWYAKVVRIQEFEPRNWRFRKDPFEETQMMLIGLKFDTLPEPHSRAIRQGIEKSFMQAMRDQQYRNWLYYKAFFLQNIVKVTFYALLAAAAFGFIYWFSLPDAKYDAKRGTLWGERFKF